MTLNTHDIFSTETVAIQSPIESEDGKVWFVSKGFRIEGGISLVDSTSVYLLFLLSFFRSHSFFFFLSPGYITVSSFIFVKFSSWVPKK